MNEVFLFNIIVEQWSYNTEIVFYLIALHIQSFEVSSYKYLWDSTNKAFDFHPRQNKQFYSLVWMDAELCFMQRKPKKQNSHPAAPHSVEIQKENKNKLQFKMYCLFSSVLICNSSEQCGQSAHSSLVWRSSEKDFWEHMNKYIEATNRATKALN